MENLKQSAIEKFSNLPLDKDTKILATNYVTLAGFDTKVEIWSWQGIYASSLIFYKADVCHLSKSELLKIIKKESNLLNNFTYKDTGEYIFFNYGFYTD